MEPNEALEAAHEQIELPEDVLQLIIAELLQSPARVAWPYLQTFALVSRVWLSSARRAMYKSPFSANFASWRAGHALLTTLRKCPHIAEMVHSLDGRNVTRSQGLLDDDRGEQVWNWQRMMIQECPALKSVGLAIDSQDHARKLVATLATRGCPDLDTIVLDSLSLFPIERPAMRVFIQEMVSHAVIASLESLVVRGLQWMPLTRLDEDGKCAEVPRDELTQAPSFPFPVHSLAFERVSIPFPDLLTLMPRPALLRSFTLTTLSDATDSIVSTATMEYLAALLGPYLTSLTLGAAPYKISYDRHHRYQQYHSGPTLPIDLFQSFPLLEHLNLTAMRGMQLNYLGTLFKSSPALVSLNLQQSVYDISLAALHGFEDALEDALQGWKTGEDDESWQPKRGQRKLHLGLLPVRGETGLPKLEEAIYLRGIRMRWDGCRTAVHEDD